MNGGDIRRYLNNVPIHSQCISFADVGVALQREEVDVVADDEDHLLRPPGDGRHTITIAIDIHDDAVFADSIGA